MLKMLEFRQYTSCKRKKGDGLTPSPFAFQNHRWDFVLWPSPAEKPLRLVLVVHFNVISLDADVNSVLTVVVTNTVAVAAAADQFATACWNTDLDVNTLWSAAATWIFAGTWIFHCDNLRLSTWRHFVAVLVNNIRVERHSV